MASRTPLARIAPWLVVAAVLGGLAVEASWPRYGEWIANVSTWVVFGFALRYATPHERRALALCVVLATLGELFLCHVWGLYTYRLGALPLFVPPGHALLFASGQALAQRASPRFVRAVFALGILGACALAAFGRTADLLWIALVLVCWMHRPGRPLYATMLVLALALELLGTAAGAWRWNAAVPWFGLTAPNPPLLAGSFYCVLDLLVLGAARQRRRNRRTHQVPEAAVGEGAP